MCNERFIQEGTQWSKPPVEHEWIERGVVSAWDWEADDPRLSGIATMAHSQDGSSIVEISFRTLRIENEDGAWEGSTMKSDLNPSSWNVLRLTGSDGYEGMTALIDFGLDGAEEQTECFDVRGVLITTPLTMGPDPFVLNGEVPPLLNEIEMTLTDTGIEPAELALSDGVYTFVVTNAGSEAHGFVLYDGDEYVSTDPEDLIEPGETRQFQIELTASAWDPGITVAILDPTNDAAAPVIIEFEDE
jgi:hypothetical protein